MSQIQPKNQTAIQAIGGFSAEDVQIMHQMFGADLTPEQFRFFVRAADAMGLNPFYGHCNPVVYKGKLSIQIQVEGYVYKGRQVEGYQGHDVQLVHENDEFKARKIKDENGRDVWEIVTHEVGFPRGKIIGGYAIAYREGFRPFVVLMDVEEVEHMKKGFNAHMWSGGFFPDMFKKHMLKRAYKGQFGIDLNDDDFERMQAGGIDSITSYQPERKDITEEVNAAAAEQQEPPKQDPEAADAKYDELRKQMNAKFKELGISGKEAKAAYIAEKGVVKGETPTLQELTKLIKLMDIDIANRAAQAADDDDLLGGFEG